MWFHCRPLPVLRPASPRSSSVHAQAQNDIYTDLVWVKAVFLLFVLWKQGVWRHSWWVWLTFRQHQHQNGRTPRILEALVFWWTHQSSLFSIRQLLFIVFRSKSFSNFISLVKQIFLQRHVAVGLEPNASTGGLARIYCEKQSEFCRVLMIQIFFEWACVHMGFSFRDITSTLIQWNILGISV